MGTAAATSVPSARAVKFVDLLREGVVSKEEYERLVVPVKDRKRRAERMDERARQPQKAQATISTPASVRFPSQLVGQAGKSLLKNEFKISDTNISFMGLIVVLADGKIVESVE